MWMRIGVLFAAVLAAFALTGAGQARPVSVGPEDAEAARAVAVLTGLADGPAPAAIPAGFAGVMGYEPQIEVDVGGTVHVVAPDGDCSTPFGATTYDFDRVCKTHDFGYDLLRYATARGGELGPWARVAIDDLLGVELRERCEAIGAGGFCRTLAGAGESVVKVNSWRQGQGNPGVESPAPYLAAGVLVALSVAVPPIAGRLARQRARS